MNALTALKLAIEEWDGISVYDGSCGSVQDRGMYAARFNGPFDEAEILEAIGATRALENTDNLSAIVGVIYTVNDIGQKSFNLYTDKRELRSEWGDYRDELEPMDYSVDGGNRVTVYSGSGRPVAFLQDEDGQALADELEGCSTEEDIQTILEPYWPC